MGIPNGVVRTSEKLGVMGYWKLLSFDEFAYCIMVIWVNFLAFHNFFVLLSLFFSVWLAFFFILFSFFLFFFVGRNGRAPRHAPAFRPTTLYIAI